MSDSRTLSSDIIIDRGISKAKSPTFKSSLAIAPLPNPSISIERMHCGTKHSVLSKVYDNWQKNY